MAADHALVSGAGLAGAAIALGGAVWGPIVLVTACAVVGAGVVVAMLETMSFRQGAAHVLTGIVNAVGFVGIAAWFLSSHVGLSDADWLFPCGLLAGAVGNRYLAAFGLIAIGWRRIRGGDNP